MGRKQKKKSKKKKKKSGSSPWAAILIALLVSAMVLSVAVRWAGMDGKASLPDEPFSIEILNGSGETGLAMRTRMELLKMGIDVLNVGDAEHYDYRESILVDRKGNPALMKKLSRLLGVRRIIVQVQERPQVDATLIIGKDSDRLKFAGGSRPGVSRP